MNQNGEPGNEVIGARLVLLGASNLTRAFPTVVQTSRNLLGAGAEILAALGHGRSYGMSSTVFFVRTLPGILQSGLWRALDQSAQARPNLPTHALITDVGNDIIYGASASTVTGWVEQCIERLARIGARISMTMVPIENIRVVTRWQYTIVKAMLFPWRRFTFEQAIAGADELDQRLRNLAAARGVEPIDCRPEWYGFDPIHIRKRHCRSAWGGILSSSLRSTGQTMKPAPMSLRRQLATLTPERWWLGGVQRGRTQPAGRLEDGTTISLF